MRKYIAVEKPTENGGYIELVRELILCKDCKWLYQDGKCPLRTWFTHYEDDYCSYAERKEE